MALFLLVSLMALGLFYFFRKLSDAETHLLAKTLKVTALVVLAIGTIVLTLLGRLPHAALAALGCLGLLKLLKYKPSQLSSSVMTPDQAYAILGLLPGATRKEINDAYKKLIIENHPDKGGSQEKAVLLNEARDLLLKKRRS